MDIIPVYALLDATRRRNDTSQQLDHICADASLEDMPSLEESDTVTFLQDFDRIVL